MKFTVLVVILSSEILGIFGIIVYDGTKESLKDQGSRRFSIQHAEPSQVSQKVLPSDGTSSGFSSVVVHRPPNAQQSDDHSGGGLTVKDPPKGWPLSEMHISFDSHGNDLKKSNEIKSSELHKEQVQQRHHTNQIEQPFNKPLQESHFHKQQHLHLTKRQPDQLKVHQQPHQLQLYPNQQEAQQTVYQQRSRQQENLHQKHEKTEVEIHPQVIIKLPEQQTTRLLRPLYVQDQSYSQQLPLSLTTQEKPFHPSVQISDSVNNEAMLTPVQYHGTHTEFSPMTKKPFSGSTKATDTITQLLNNNNKAKNIYLTPGANEEKFPRDSTKVVRMRHPHTTLGASYSVGFTTPADAFKNSNQLQNLIIKENIENKGPIRHGKTLHRQKPPNGLEINNELVLHNKKAPPLQTPTYSISSEVLKNDNYEFIDGGRHQLGISSDSFTSAVNNQPPLINTVSPGAHSSAIRFHHSPNGQHSSPHLTFEEPRQVPIGALQYQKLLTRELVPPPARTHVTSEGKSHGPPSLGFLPQRSGHPNPALTSNKIIKFVPAGPVNNAFNEANNLHYISETRNAVHQNYPLLQSHYATGGVYDSVNEKGNQGSATTGNTVSSSIPVGQNHVHRHLANSGGSSEFRGFSKSVPLYSTTQGHAHLIPTKFHGEPHTQHIADATKHSASHTKVTASAQGIKSAFVSGHPSQSSNPSSNINQHESQKGVENVFAGFKNGQFQGGFGGNIGYSFAGQDFRNPLTHLVHVGNNNGHASSHGNAGAVGQHILQFDKNTPQNIPGYLNLNNGAVHLGHPGGPFLYQQQPLLQHPGGHVQTLYVPGAGTPHTLYTNSLLGVGHPIGMQTLVTNIQSSAEASANQGQVTPTGAGTPPSVFSGTPLTYYREHVVNAVPQGNVEVGGSTFPHTQTVAFPGIGAAYPQNVHFPYNGGAGTTFVLSQAPLQEYRQQGHLQPVGIPQHSSTFPSRVNNVQTQNVGGTHANSFGAKLTQQHHPNPQHGTTSSSSQKQ